MKKLLFLGACFWMLTRASAQTQTVPADVAVVRVFESNSSVNAVVTRQGRSESAQFERGINEKGLAQASEGYQKLLTLLYQEGYTLESTFTTPTQYGGNYITLILSKKR